mgnify:CR=1 FL=1|jgi:hypothetical protein
MGLANPSAALLSSAGTGMKTNLLFFTEGSLTESIWYYDVSDARITKKNPLTLEHFSEFLPVCFLTETTVSELDRYT